MIMDLENLNIYDLKNLLFKAVVDENKELEKAVKKQIKVKLKSIGNFMFN